MHKIPCIPGKRLMQNGNHCCQFRLTKHLNYYRWKLQDKHSSKNLLTFIFNTQHLYSIPITIRLGGPQTLREINTHIARSITKFCQCFRVSKTNTSRNTQQNCLNLEYISIILSRFRDKLGVFLLVFSSLPVKNSGIGTTIT